MDRLKKKLLWAIPAALLLAGGLLLGIRLIAGRQTPAETTAELKAATESAGAPSASGGGCGTARTGLSGDPRSTGTASRYQPRRATGSTNRSGTAAPAVHLPRVQADRPAAPGPNDARPTDRTGPAHQTTPSGAPIPKPSVNRDLESSNQPRGTAVPTGRPSARPIIRTTVRPTVRPATRPTIRTTVRPNTTATTTGRITKPTAGITTADTTTRGTATTRGTTATRATLTTATTPTRATIPTTAATTATTTSAATTPTTATTPKETEPKETEPKETELLTTGFTLFLSATRGDGSLRYPAGRTVSLPDEALVGRLSTGENSGELLGLSWSGSDLPRVTAGIAGDYRLIVALRDDLIINGHNYGKIHFAVNIRIQA